MTLPLTLPDVLNQVGGSRTILVAAGDASSTDYASPLDVAITLASRLDARLALVDRSKVTLGDTLHIEGPLSDERATADGRLHLVEQAGMARAAGVRDIELWATSMPTVDGVGVVAARVHPDVVVIPAVMQDPTLVERITLRHLPDKVAESRRSTRTVFHIIAVATDGGLRLVT